MLSDEQLVEAALAGEAGAFGQLVDRYQDRLLRFLVTRAQSRADAEDATQDTFLAAYRYLSSFNPRWRFSTWLYRIALRNLARIAPSTGGTADAEPVEHRDPLAACIVASQRENIWLSAKRELAPDAFDALWLRYAEEMPVKEVARALDRSNSWVKVTLMRSRQKLKQTLTEPAAAGSKSYG